MSKTILEIKSKTYAIESVMLAKTLMQKNEFILSKQLLRSATSVGANYREAKNAFSPKDFIYKLSICQKECDESIYWLELLKETNYISEEQFTQLENQATQLLKMIRSSILTVKQNHPH
jgi:four helix bundle protein